MSLFNKFEMFDVCTYRFCFLMLDESLYKKYIQYCKARYIQVVPGRAGGGSFRRKKKYIAKKEFCL